MRLNVACARKEQVIARKDREWIVQIASAHDFPKSPAAPAAGMEAQVGAAVQRRGR